MIAESTTSPSPPVELSWYVERQPTPKSFADWAEQRKPSQPSTRLRSIVGPPGSGKTTFLWALTRILRERRLVVVQLDLTSKTLQQPTVWLIGELKELERAGHIVLTIAPEQLANQDFHRVWLVLVRALRNQPAVLLVDGFDETDSANRGWIEYEVLVPFLFRSGERGESRAVIARRDEYALTEATLRWEDDVHPLQGLRDEQTIKQIDERLAAVARAVQDARKILEWPDAPAAIIDLAVTFNETDRAALINRLKQCLTPNPFVNLLLLQRQLQRPDEPLNVTDHRACLENYLRRAGLKATSSDELIALINRQNDPSSFRLSDLSEKQGHFEVRERVKGLIEAGMVSQIPGTARYRFDPAIIQLVKRLKDNGSVAA